MSEFYVYVHFRNDNKKPFYVGKGKGKRFIHSHGRNKYWWNVVIKAGGYFIRKVQQNLSNEQANEREKYWIKFYRGNGFKLTNLTEGGEGVEGRVCSIETRKKMSEWQKGRALPPEHIKKISDSKKGKPSPRKGVKLSIELRKKLSEAHKGKPLTLETRKKLSLILKGRPSPLKGTKLSLETRKKMSAAHKGKTHSLASRIKISITKTYLKNKKTKTK